MAAAAAAPSPLTGVGWAAGPEAVPPGWTAITVTAEGAPAAVGKGFGHRGGGWYLCVRSAAGQVTGGTGTGGSGISRRKRLLVKLEDAEGSVPAVVELQLSSKGRSLPLYTRIG
ncbi:multivesicular body subunit 12A-like, partial [Empidonax traillii]|uniref:multivesicular body subunit 12A-like n=1 Tax=Empidonax traillii TaxID=164674 RepID=UPI000FFCF93E